MLNSKKMFFAFLIVFAVLTIGTASADANADMTMAVDDAIAIDNSQNNAMQESDVAAENNPPETFETAENDDDLQQEDQSQEQLGFTSDDLKVDFPESGSIGHGDDNDCIYFNISIPKGSSGKMSIYENGNSIASFESNQSNYAQDRVYISYFTKDPEDLYAAYVYPSKAGIVNYAIKYEIGSETFEKSADINISYLLGCFDQSFYGDTTLQIFTPYYGTGSIKVLIDGKAYSTYKNADGYFVKLNPLLSIGKHKISITYLGEDRYPERTAEQTLTVIGKIKIPTSKFTNNEVISIKLPAKAIGSLVVKVYNYKGKVVKTFTQKLVNGKASISFSKYKFYGTYSYITAKYTGKDYKVSNEIMDEVTINPPIVLTKKMLKGEKKYLSINLPGKKGVLKLYYQVKDKSGTYVTKVLSKKLVDGKAKISIPKLATGTHDIKVKFIETLKNGKKDSYVYYRKLTVVKPLKITSAKKLYYGTAKVQIQAYKSGGKALVGKYITIKINKKIVKKVKTNSKGVATFKIPKKYKPNTYKITAIYNKYTTSKKIRIYKASA